jgi:hypothetical protein
MAPFYANISMKFPQSVFLKVDAEALRPISSKYSVTAYPTFLAIRGDQQDVLRGADPQGLVSLISCHAGPNPPLPPLPPDAENGYLWPVLAVIMQILMQPLCRGAGFYIIENRIHKGATSLHGLRWNCQTIKNIESLSQEIFKQAHHVCTKNHCK